MKLPDAPSDNTTVDPADPPENELPVLVDVVESAPEAPPSDRQPTGPSAADAETARRVTEQLRQRLALNLDALVEASVQATLENILPQWEAALRAELRAQVTRRIEQWLDEDPATPGHIS